MQQATPSLLPSAPAGGRPRGALQASRVAAVAALLALLLSACGGQAPAPSSAPLAAGPTAGAAAAPSPTAAQPLVPSAASPVTSPAAGGVAAVASPAALPSGASPRDGGVVTVGMWSPPTNFSPVNTDSWYTTYATYPILDAFVTVDPNVKYVPKLAERWEFSADNRQVTFSINKNAKWHDGRPVTAGDYEYTLRIMTDPKTDSTQGTNLAALAGTNASGRRDGDAELGITVIDDKTIRLTMKQPVDQLYVLEKFGYQVRTLPRHLLETVAPQDLAAADYFQRPTVGNGPFRFVRYETGQFIEYERNPDYYLGRPRLEKIIVRVVAPQVMVANLEKGEVDMTAGPGIGDIPLDDWERIKALPNLNAYSIAGVGFQFMDINTSHPALGDKRVRQALVYGINRQLMVDQLLKGQGAVQNGPIPTLSPYYDRSLKTVPYDPQRARQLLEEAGWDFNTELQLSVPTGNLTRERSADIVKANLDAIGFKVRIQKMDFPTLQAEAREGKYALRLVGWSALFDPDVSSAFRAGGPLNYGKFDNPRLNDLLDRGLRESRFEARKEIYDAVQQALQDEVPWVFLYSPNPLQAANKRLQGVTYSGWTPAILWNVHEWWVSQ